MTPSAPPSPAPPLAGPTVGAVDVVIPVYQERGPALRGTLATLAAQSVAIWENRSTSMVKETRNIHRRVLPNGLTVITEQMSHIRSVSIGIWLKSGSRDEDSECNGKQGAAHSSNHQLKGILVAVNRGSKDFIVIGLHRSDISLDVWARKSARNIYENLCFLASRS